MAFRNMKGKIADVLQETELLIQAVQDGKLEARGNVELFAGGWRELVIGINNVIDALMAPFNVATEYVDRIAKGDIPQKITDEYRGDFNEIKNNLNLLIDAMNETTRIAEEIARGNLMLEARERSEHDTLMRSLNVMIQRLKDILQQTNTLIHAIQEGKLDARGSSETLSGGWLELVVGINKLIDAFVTPINCDRRIYRPAFQRRYSRRNYRGLSRRFQRNQK